ncbi:LOW QUALITY PROTEIN: lysophospholipid acyltransferase 5-like [Lampetra fluviatilis]
MGGIRMESLSTEQGVYAQRRRPSLLEVAGFGLFYGGLLVGPQFSLRQYLRHCHGELTPSPGQPPQSVAPALERMALGLFYVLVFAVGGPYFPDSYLLSAEYQAQPLWYRCVHLAFWGKIALYKYLCCWLLAEGVCILCGLGYAGRGADGRCRWDACCNIHVAQFERTALFTGTIASFNTNTNAWVARCVFKRLRWLGSKALSQFAALAFLSVWHGLHSGYAVCFSFEFLVVTVEKQALDLVRRCPSLSTLSTSTPLRVLLYPPHQLFHCMFMGYPLSAFCLFSYSKWMQVYSSVYFCGHVVFLSLLLLLLPLLRLLLLPPPAAAAAAAQKRNSSKQD